MLMSLVTAFAWIWGTAMLLGFLYLGFCSYKNKSKEDAKDSASAFIYGIPAWAWLIARYLIVNHGHG